MVPTGYADDVEVADFATASSAVAAYVKNGFSDYSMINQAEILALMGSSDLLAKTGTTTDEDIWLDLINIEQTQAKTYIYSSGAIENKPVDESHYYIAVRRVEVV